MAEYIKYGVSIVILILIQKTLVWLLAITDYHITPDLVLIGIVFLGIKYGKIPGSVGGFAAGLILDLFSFSFIGLSALSKATAGFVAGFFENENKFGKYTQTYIFILIILLSSIFNNFLYFLLYYQGTALNFSSIFGRYIIPTAVYTSLVSIPLIFYNRRRSRL